jgi:(1->4)-alpha-D-glucan 1-alpha-D-glucosylmutase
MSRKAPVSRTKKKLSETKPKVRTPRRGNCPSSTYRLQVHAGFTLDDATEVLDYLAELGISHAYLSPYLQAANGSTHGYDPVDPSSVNVELGGKAAHQRFCARLEELGLGQILDIVPNHMAVAPNNKYWWDILENGSSSRYANYFDIDWQPTESRLQNKVLVPVLSDQYGAELDRGAIQLTRSEGRFEVQYGEHHLPVAPETLPMLLDCAAQTCRSATMAFLSESFGRLPQPAFTDRAATWARHRDKEVLVGLLERCCNEERKSFHCIDECMKKLNGHKDELDAFLQKQNYRLAYWRVASEEIGYRRFFDVNTLIGVRAEREQVFMETHERILEWLRGGVIDGVRVDHADGLRDPQQYFERLRRTAPRAYIVVEKILQRGERLQPGWPIHGTTGYEFIDHANGLLLSDEGLGEIERIYGEFTGESVDFAAMAHEKKLNVEQAGLGSDVTRLTMLFLEICENDRHHRDYTRPDVRRAVREIAANFPVYRTYVAPERNEAGPRDRAYIREAVDGAKRQRTDIDARLFDFMGDVLTLKRRGALESEFVLRFQQFTSPVMAKGVEDTALYCFNRLLAVNEVGGETALPALSVDEFHALNADAQKHHPLRMLALTTHDTKRSEDVRARLLALTEFPREFGEAVRRWSARLAKEEKAGPLDRNTQYFFFQTVIGAWPLREERAVASMEKAVREAKVHTSWTKRTQDYEDSLREFVRESLSSQEFVTEVEQFVASLDGVANVNSLAQTLLKYTVPGVPDLYQGSELWDYRLVDPDNRTPVDFKLRAKLLAEMTGATCQDVLAKMNEGLPKLWVIRKALEARKRHARSFGANGSYTPVAAEGTAAGHVVAFLRGADVAVAVPRLTRKLRAQGGPMQWGDTHVELPGGRWSNALTGEEMDGGAIMMGDLLREFPVALLIRS